MLKNGWKKCFNQQAFKSWLKYTTTTSLIVTSLVSTFQITTVFDGLKYAQQFDEQMKHENKILNENVSTANQ